MFTLTVTPIGMSTIHYVLSGDLKYLPGFPLIPLSLTYVQEMQKSVTFNLAKHEKKMDILREESSSNALQSKT